MSQTEFQELAEQFRAATDVINGFKSEQVQLRAIEALIATFHGEARAARPKVPKSEQNGPEPDTSPRGNGRTPSSAGGGERGTTRKRATSEFEFLRDLDLHPAGIESIDVFMKRAQPSNNDERILACIHWFVEIGRIMPITGDMLWTAFRVLDWQLPANFSNKLSQAGSRGYINQADRTDVKLTSKGLNHVNQVMLKRPVKS